MPKLCDDKRTRKTINVSSAINVSNILNQFDQSSLDIGFNSLDPVVSGRCFISNLLRLIFHFKLQCNSNYFIAFITWEGIENRRVDSSFIVVRV